MLLLVPAVNIFLSKHQYLTIQSEHHCSLPVNVIEINLWGRDRNLNVHLMKMLFDFSLSRDARRDVSIDMETEEEWEAISFNPNQPLIAQKVPLPHSHSLTHSLVHSLWASDGRGSVFGFFPRAVCLYRWQVVCWHADGGSGGGASTSPGCWLAVPALDISSWPTCSPYTYSSSCASPVHCSKVRRCLSVCCIKHGMTHMPAKDAVNVTRKVKENLWHHWIHIKNVQITCFYYAELCLNNCQSSLKGTVHPKISSFGVSRSVLEVSVVMSCDDGASILELKAPKPLLENSTATFVSSWIMNQFKTTELTSWRTISFMYHCAEQTVYLLVGVRQMVVFLKVWKTIKAGFGKFEKNLNFYLFILIFPGILVKKFNIRVLRLGCKIRVFPQILTLSFLRIPTFVLKTLIIVRKVFFKS